MEYIAAIESYWKNRAAEFDTLDAEEKVRANEVDMAKTLIQNLTEPWKPEAYKDEYREALMDIVERKAAGQPIQKLRPRPRPRVSST